MTRRPLLSVFAAAGLEIAGCGRGAPPVTVAVGEAPPAPPAAPNAPPPPAPAKTPPPQVPDERAIDDARRALVSIMARKGPSPREGEAWARAVGVLVEVLEQAGREEKTRLVAAQALLDAQEGRGLPDADVGRILAVARAHTPSCPVKEPAMAPGCAFRGLLPNGGLDVTLARLAIRMSTEPLGRLPEVRELVALHPGSTFQAVMLEEMRHGYETSGARVMILGEKVETGTPEEQRGALDGLAAAWPIEVPPAACSGLGAGLFARSPEVVLRAAIHLARSGCPPILRDRALGWIEASTKRGPLPPGRLDLLCAHSLKDADRARPWAALRAIAKSPVQPLATRRDAMSGFHACGGAPWGALFAELSRDPDAAVQAAAAEVDKSRFVNICY